MYLLILLLVILFSFAVVKGIPARFADASEFYHDLDEDALEFVLQRMTLNERTVVILGRLLADERFNMQSIYDRKCNLMSKDRAMAILSLVNNRKDLEMHLLGPGCLSKAIIEARKSLLNMWPPTGFPLLLDKLELRKHDIDDIRDILWEALKQPKWLYSTKWAYGVPWYHIDKTPFWRMLPFDHSVLLSPEESSCNLTLSKISEHPNHQILEELLMKNIHSPSFSYAFKNALEGRKLDLSTLLSKFSHLQDSWSVKVLDLLQKMYADGPHTWNLHILKSGLLSLDSWKEPLSIGTIDMEMAINDIFVLFIAMLRHPKGAQMDGREIEQLLMAFIDRVSDDWSRVRPMVLVSAVEAIPFQLWKGPLKKHVNRMLEDPNTIAVMPEQILQSASNLQSWRYSSRKRIKPLRGTFVRRTGYNDWMHLDMYPDMLFQEWEKDRKNWPGLAATHRAKNGRIRRVFKLSNDEGATWDPRTHKTYSERDWSLAFGSIKFDLENGIPCSTVLSSCFLRALRRFQENKMNWNDLQSEFGQECDFPTNPTERRRYVEALKEADSCLFYGPDRLPIANFEFLQAILRGDPSASVGQPTIYMERQTAQCILQ